jgi:penicillin G amidase
MAARAARGAAASALLLVTALMSGWWWAGRSIPPLDGRITLSGLQAPVEVRFDGFAIPHIYAGTDDDAWEAVGYLQGRDRLWQMELYRRVASGRLSELLGDATLAVDQRFLTLGLRRAAEVEWQRMTPSVRTAFERHARGVSAAMAVGWGERPLEFQLLRLNPERWTPIDSLAIGKLFAWRLGENHRAELLRYSLSQVLGARVAELFPGSPAWAPTILDNRQGRGERAGRSSIVDRPSSIVDRRAAPVAPNANRLSTDDYRRSTIDRRLATIDCPPGLQWLSANGHAMSNSWVIHGSRTSSGRPLLANDPHLLIEMPSVWWEAHIVSDTLNVTGVTIPGIPFVIIGHNEHLAWGLTNVGADVQDFYLEALDASRLQYLAGEVWLPLEIARHDIRVRGKDKPVQFEVFSTRHGPLQTVDGWRDLYPGDEPEPAPFAREVLALKWDAVLEGQSAAAFDALARAKSWLEFLSAVRRFSAPAQSFVYADVDGNIGYAMSGLLPVRPFHDGTAPVRGSREEADWRGSVDPNELPVVLNPPSGQIVTANNEVDRKLPFLITRDWVAPFRAQRIIELLGDKRRLDVAAMAQMQADVVSASADWILDAVGSALPIEELRSWDRRVDDRPVVLLYEAFEEALWRRTFADEMPVELFERFYRYAGNERFAGLHGIITDAGSPWFDDRATSEVRETRDDIVVQAANDAMASLRVRFGDQASWRWDRAHALQFSHALSGGGTLLDWFFSRGPVPVVGDGMTVNKTTTNLRRPYGTSEAASYRQILDVGAWDQSLAVNTTGQSGHPRSPHYFDQNVLWHQGRYHPMPFTREAVEKATVSRLELVPK